MSVQDNVITCTYSINFIKIVKARCALLTFFYSIFDYKELIFGRYTDYHACSGWDHCKSKLSTIFFFIVQCCFRLDTY